MGWGYAIFLLILMPYGQFLKRKIENNVKETFFARRTSIANIVTQAIFARRASISIEDNKGGTIFARRASISI